jgi:radical SAM superfamily enzyme YgiQ (UPF0313 family)
MNILLVLPYDGTYRFHGGFRRSLSYAPLTLATLAALVPNDLHASIAIIDEGVQRPVVPAAGYDIVGISCVTSSSPRAYELAKAFRSLGSVVVLGGAHPTLNPGEASGQADAVVIGPAFGAWPAVVRTIASKEKLRKIYKGEFPDGRPIPLPARHLLANRGYLGIPTVIATQGCVNRCRFCSIHHLWNGAAYSRPLGDVIDEIAGFGSKSVLFLDPNIIADRSYALELFTALACRKVSWAGLATCDMAFDGELLDAAARSGCIGVLTGFESLSQASLDACGKGRNRVARFGEAVRIFHSHRIRVLGCFVLGFDEDTPETLRNSAELADDLNVDVSRFAVLTPFPGTQLFTSLKAQGRILTENWLLYDTEHVVFQPARMDAAALQETLYRTWRQSYSLRRIARRVRPFAGRGLLCAAVNLGFAAYRRHIKKHIPGPAKGGDSPCR